MTSNLFTNRMKKQQAPKICIAPPVNPINPLTPIADRLLCWTAWNFNSGAPGEIILSEQYLLIQTGPDLTFRGESPPTREYFITDLQIQPDYKTYTLTVNVILTSGPFRVYGPAANAVRQPDPFDTGQLTNYAYLQEFFNRITI